MSYKSTIKLLLFALVIGLLSFSAAWGKNGPVRVAILTDGPIQRFRDGIRILKKEVRHLTEGEFEVLFPDDLIVAGDWTVEGIERRLDQLLADPRVDAVIAAGYVASNGACRRRDLRRPVIAPLVLDAGAQGLPLRDGATGVPNLVYINEFHGLAGDLRAFAEVVPFRRVAVLLSGHILDAMPELDAVARKAGALADARVTLVPVGAGADDALARIPDDAEAVFVAPVSRLDAKAFQALVEGLKARKLPSFSFWGRDEVEAGLLATATPEGTFEHLTRNVAVHLLEVLRGTDAGTLDVGFLHGEQLMINMATARAIGVSPSLFVLTEAELLNEKPVAPGRTLRLAAVVAEAEKASLDLAVADRDVAAGGERVREARSPLLPSVDLAAGGVVVDEDRAAASLGSAPEKSFSGGATARQVLYSEDAWAGYMVERRLQKARREDRETVRLDVVRDAATTYLNVLRAMTIEGIQKENLRLTRANLERARIRVSVGAAGPEEVYRWDSEIATRRRSVLDAESATRDAVHALNRILNRPLGDRFQATEARPGGPLESVIDDGFYDFLRSDRSLHALRAFMVREGLAASPELKSLDAVIRARERALTAARRAFWLPVFFAEGTVSERFSKSGAGSEPPSALPITPADDTDWSLGVFASFPLVEGGGKFATARRVNEELARLRIRREATADRIEERIWNAVDRIRASYPGIRLARDASAAARQNLDRVTDAYAEGIKSIIDLLDAQNLSLVADQRAANAVYDFLVDLATLQRAVGRFDLFSSRTDQRAWIDRLRATPSDNAAEAGAPAR